jgi:hypothetical protein
MYMNSAASPEFVRPRASIVGAISLCLFGVVATGLYPRPIVDGGIEAARPFFQRAAQARSGALPGAQHETRQIHVNTR